MLKRITLLYSCSQKALWVCLIGVLGDVSPAHSGQSFYTLDMPEDLKTVSQEITTYSRFPETLCIKNAPQDRFCVWQLLRKDLPQPVLPRKDSSCCYRLHYHPLSDTEAKALFDNEHWKALHSVHKKFLVTHNTNLRERPLEEPLFDDPQKAGNGYPFDILQRSRLTPCRPILLSHYSLDGVWAYVYASPTEMGWVLVEHIAPVTPKMVSFLKSTSWAVVTKDRTLLRTMSGKTVLADIGTFFPIVSKTKEGLCLSIPDTCDGALHFHVSKVVPHHSAASYPLVWDKKRAHMLLSSMQKDIYGWGMLHGHRDCSSFIKDFFSVFGLGLPRNSSDQAAYLKKDYTFVDVSSLSEEDKVRTLQQQGIPYQTLLFVQGHVGLYVGDDPLGRPIMLHCVWGVRLKNEDSFGRAIIGRPILSTLSYGKEMPLADPKEQFLYKFYGFGVLKTQKKGNNA